jgi:hypothetical protein
MNFSHFGGNQNHCEWLKTNFSAILKSCEKNFLFFQNLNSDKKKSDGKSGA